MRSSNRRSRRKVWLLCNKHDNLLASIAGAILLLCYAGRTAVVTGHRPLFVMGHIAVTFKGRLKYILITKIGNRAHE